MIDIVRASAGSGKTFTLARKYISLLMKSDDRYAYRHILAVTFTNKATEEMKSRILKELHLLSTDPASSDYVDDMKKIFNSLESIQKKASEILTNILHDYSAFSVSTIDKFFQRALKAFAREIGQFPSYKVELDKKSLVAESVDRILDAIDEKDRDLLEWLIDSAKESLLKGGHFNLEKGLYDAAEGVKSDDFSNLVKEKGIDVASFYSKKNLTKVRMACEAYMKSYREDIVQAAEEIRKSFADAGIELKDTAYKFMSKTVGRYLAAADVNTNITIDDTFIRNVSGFISDGEVKSWFPRTKSANCGKLTVQIGDAVTRLYNLLGEPYRLFITLSTIHQQTYNLGIVKEINDEFQELIKEKNVVSLDETNDILNRIISGTEAPFIYEKLGVRFESFLLDEFQDTSVVQWENFKPLIEESQANGNESLIVGDVKQSIYRWRGGDWNLLANGVEQDMHGEIHCKTLDTNWRSSRHIIEFNNAFFTYAIGRLKERDNSRPEVLSAIYSDVVQKVSPGKLDAPVNEQGSVEVTFTEDVVQEILISIGNVLSVGGNYGQIAILVRDNLHGSKIAKELALRSIPVISDEALLVKSSSVIARLVALLYYIDTDYVDGKVKSQKRMVNTYLAEHLAVTIPDNYGSLADLCEGLLRGLRDNDSERFDREVPYIEAFMDELKDWSSNNGNNLRAFLTYWEGANPKLSSPGSSDAVTIFTIHKSKGLEFEYVIFPYTEEVTLFKNTENWCIPDFKGVKDADTLDFIGKGAYQVNLSGMYDSSLFSAQYRQEYFMQTVDNLNVFYVALTRAKKGLHLISSLPPKSFLSSFGKTGKLDEALDFNKLMYAYLHTSPLAEEVKGRPEMKSSDLPEEYKDSDYASAVRESFMYGELYPFGQIQTETCRFTMQDCVYPSYALNPVCRNEEGEEVQMERLGFSSDAVDFFGEDGNVGVEASNRIRGTVLHQILSMVVVPSDLDKAAASVMRQGIINQEQADEAKAFLSAAIAGVEKMGWFPEDGKGVRNEASIFDPEGHIFRPDRLLLQDEKATVIDYKFGEPEARYRSQVSRYAGLLAQLGYKNVKAYLWYVGKETGNIEEVL